MPTEPTNPAADPRSRLEKLMDSNRRADEREAGMGPTERRDSTAYENQQQGFVNQLYDAHFQRMDDKRDVEAGLAYGETRPYATKEYDGAK